MRISDWTSDVCSSDLAELRHRGAELFQPDGDEGEDAPFRRYSGAGRLLQAAAEPEGEAGADHRRDAPAGGADETGGGAALARRGDGGDRPDRKSTRLNSSH